MMLTPLPLLAALQADPATHVILERTWLDQVAIVGQSLVSLLVLILLVTATFALLALRRALDELTRLVRSTSADITGAVHDARMVVEEVRNLSGRVRGTADVVRAGVRRAKHMVDVVRDTDRPEKRDRGDRPERTEGGESSFEEPSMAEMHREERSLRKRRRRRRGDRPRPPMDGGGDRGGPDGGAE